MTGESRATVQKILVLIANRENRRLLTELLAPDYEVEYDFPGEGSADAQPDMCIVDGISLDAEWQRIRAAREAQDPVLLPVLLLSNRRDVGLVTRELWRVVDDVLLRPVERVELRARIGTLARARRLSLRLRKTNDLYEHESRIARRFQETAMPRALPTVPGMRFSAFYEPGTSEAHIGGDWYDAVALSDRRVVLSIGDVCGAGLEAAVAMVNVRHVLRALGQVHPDPAAMLDGADRALQTDEDERIVTAFVAVYDPVTAQLTYASAGHPSPLLCTEDGEVSVLPCEAGLPLGIVSRESRAVHTIQIASPSLLVLYTDGLTEATRDPVDGERRLRDALLDPSVVHAHDVARVLRDAVLPDGSRDDVAILAVEITPLEIQSALKRWTLDAREPAAAKAVQHAFLAELEHQGIPPDDLFVAELVFAELLGNVVRYAPSEVEVILDWMGPNPVLHMLDEGPGFHPIPRLPPDALSERGRGVFIVASLARDFHVMPRAEGGSHARAVLALKRPARRAETRVMHAG